MLPGRPCNCVIRTELAPGGHRSLLQAAAGNELKAVLRIMHTQPRVSG